MTAAILAMPDLDPAHRSGFITRWLIPHGTPVDTGDVVAEIVVGRAQTDLRAPRPGVLRHSCVEQTDVPVGTSLAELSDADTGATDRHAPSVGVRINEFVIAADLDAADVLQIVRATLDHRRDTSVQESDPSAVLSIPPIPTGSTMLICVGRAADHAVVVTPEPGYQALGIRRTVLISVTYRHPDISPTDLSKCCTTIEAALRPT